MICKPGVYLAFGKGVEIKMEKGKIVEIMGPVVDVEFEDNDLPYIKDALEVDNNGKRCVMEVAQHIGNNTVRCIMLAASEGLCKDMEVIAEGGGIKVPVGNKTLGRLFNVLGDTLDGGESLAPPPIAGTCFPVLSFWMYSSCRFFLSFPFE